MENPEVVILITTTKPTADTVLWADTEEGNLYFNHLINHYTSYVPNIDVSIEESDDKLINTIIIKYKTREIYEESRMKILSEIPDFYEKKDAYDSRHGITFVQDIQM
jgi:hypothetical protein